MTRSHFSYVRVAVASRLRVWQPLTCKRACENGAGVGHRSVRQAKVRQGFRSEKTAANVSPKVPRALLAGDACSNYGDS